LAETQRISRWSLDSFLAGALSSPKFSCSQMAPLSRPGLSGHLLAESSEELFPFPRPIFPGDDSPSPLTPALNSAAHAHRFCGPPFVVEKFFCRFSTPYPPRGRSHSCSCITRIFQDFATLFLSCHPYMEERTSPLPPKEDPRGSRVDRLPKRRHIGLIFPRQLKHFRLRKDFPTHESPSCFLPAVAKNMAVSEPSLVSDF